MNQLENFSSWSWCIFCIIIGILAIQFVIAFHELGHWLFCKLFNIKTPSFSIGFGPRLFTKKIGDTVFAISAIPLGGYVEISGAAEVGQGEQKEAHSSDETSFESKPYYQKLLVMLGGILFNIIFAISCFIGLWLIGMPKSLLFYPKYSKPVIEKIIKDSPAEKAGLKIGQEIIKFGDIKIKSTEQLLNLIKASPNKTINLNVLDKIGTINIPVTIGSQPADATSGYFGAIYETIAPGKAPSFLSAIKRSLNLTIDLARRTFNGLFAAFSKRTTEGMGGPLRLFSDAAEQTNKGWSNLFLLLAIISIGLAVLNILPLPVFDGGQVVTYTIEAIIGKKLPEQVKYYLHVGTWVILLAFILYLTFKDATHIFTKITGK